MGVVAGHELETLTAPASKLAVVVVNMLRAGLPHEQSLNVGVGVVFALARGVGLELAVGAPQQSLATL